MSCRNRSAWEGLACLDEVLHGGAVGAPRGVRVERLRPLRLVLLRRVQGVEGGVRQQKASAEADGRTSVVLAVAVVDRVLGDHQPRGDHQVVDGRSVRMAGDHVAPDGEAVELAPPSPRGTGRPRPRAQALILRLTSSTRAGSGSGTGW